MESPPEPVTPLPHIEVVEAILGIPLRPEGIDNVPITKDTIRGFAYAAVVKEVQKRFSAERPPDLLEIDPGVVAQLGAESDFRYLAAHIKAANDTLSNWHRPPAMPYNTDHHGTARSRFQAGAMNSIVQHGQRAPRRQAIDDKDDIYDGLLTVAPTGSGKTVLQGLLFNYAGIGLPISEIDPRPRTAVGITNSRLLIEQGLEPSEPLQCFVNIGGGSVPIGAYYGGRYDGHDTHPILLTTPASYPKAVASGAINPETTVRYALDEAHVSALAPKMQSHIERLARFGAGLYMFTATPAIAGGRRDLRKQFPYSQFGSLREFVEDGILSPVRLFTYRAGPEADSAENIAISLAADYVEKGYKTLIVCQPGEGLSQARSIANRLNELYSKQRFKPHASFGWDSSCAEIADVIGNSPDLNTQATLAALRRGERLVVTTVKSGQEGLNILDLNALIIIGPKGAAWEVEQWIGRILRPSGRIAIASEILPHELHPGKRLASIFGAFGMQHEIIVPGYPIGPIINEQPEPLPQAPRLTPPPAIADKTQSLGSGEPSTSETDSPIDTEHFSPPYAPPTKLQDLLVRYTSVREATIAPADLAKLPPSDYKPLTTLAPEGVPVEWLHNVMDKQNSPAIRYIGVWELNEDNEMTYVRYYSPGAHNYFAKHPIPQMASKEEFLDQQMADMLGVSRRCVGDIIERLGLQPLNRIVKHHRKPRYFDMEAFSKIATEVQLVPWADETDVALIDLGNEMTRRYAFYYATHPRNNIVPVEKRRHPTWGVKGIVLHITGAEAAEIRASYIALEVADKTKFMNGPDIAKLAGIPFGTASKRLNDIPEDRRPPTRWLRSAAKFVPSEHFTKEWGEAFVEFIKPEKVLPWEVTLTMVALYFGLERQTARKVIRRYTTALPEQLQLPGVSKADLWRVSVIVDISERIKPVRSSPTIDPNLAALSAEHASDPDRIAYSQTIQGLFIPKEQLPAPYEIPYYLARRESPPTLPLPHLGAESSLVKPTQLGPMSGALPVTAKARSGLVSREDARAMTGCTPEVFTILLRRAGLTADDRYIDKQGALSLRPTGMVKLENICKNIAPPFREWWSAASVAKASHATVERVMQTLREIEIGRGQIMGEDELQLGRDGSEIQVYMPPRLKALVRRTILDI